MPFDTKAVKVDINGKPVPQFFNTAIDDYQVLTEEELYKLVKQAIDGKDFATQTTLAGILSGLTDGTQKVLVDNLPATQNVALTGNTIPDAQAIPTKLTGSSLELSGLAADRPAAAAGNKGKTYWSIDTGDVSVSTGTTWRHIGVV